MAPAVDLIEVPFADKAILANLLQLYLHDFSEVTGWTINEHGLFDYHYLDHYWTEPGRFPFLFRVEGALAGFALVRSLEPGTDDGGHSMAEFFVLRGFRRTGVGDAAARALFARFPGRWVVSELEPNVDAQQFWRRVIARYTGGAYTERREPSGRVVQEFDSTATPDTPKPTIG